MEGLGLFADGELYAVDVTLVEKVVRNIKYTPVFAAPRAVAGITSMKGGMVTLLSLSELLGRDRSARAVHAVIFKPLTDGNDQMGLLIDKPESIVSIDDNGILNADVLGETSVVTSFAEVGDKLYRIIDIDLINKQFKD